MNHRSKVVKTNPIKESQSLQRYRKILFKLLKENCTQYPWAEPVVKCLRHDDWPGLWVWAESVTTEVYGDAAEHYAATQISALIRKYPLDYRELGLTESPRDVAVRKFLSSETMCKLTNKRFSTLGRRYTRYREHLEYMRSWIKNVLGDKPDMKKIHESCGFSSGAAIGVHGNATNLYRKLFSENWSVGPLAFSHAMSAIRSNDQILISLMETRHGMVCFDIDHAMTVARQKCSEKPFNKVSFVPKTASTERSIAVEPLLNSFVQKGIDQYMRGLLRSRGYDLSDQSRNSFLARQGSIDGILATVDLSSASDTISSELVRFLLPPSWFDLLNSVRSHKYSLDGKTSKYEKFTSMGNGFCFPLETLIFASCVRASIYFSRTKTKTHSVYGDDIIIASEAVPFLSKLMAYCGFKVNHEKSFENGPFRESCGADWYEGQDVRPVYMDYRLSDDLRLMIFHNATLRGSRQEAFFEGVREMIRDWVPFHQRLVRPRSYYVPPASSASFEDKMRSNGAFAVELDTFMGGKWVKWDRDTQNWKWREVLCTPQADRDVGPNYHRAQYLALLSGSPQGMLNLRRKVKLTYKYK